GIGGAIEAWGLALEEHTLHHAWHALPPQSADVRTEAYALAASNSDSSARRDRSAVIGAGRPMRLGARTLYQRLTPSSTARAAPRQRTRSGVIERSKWVKACSSWPSVRGSTAASPGSRARRRRSEERRVGKEGRARGSRAREEKKKRVTEQ